MYEFGENALFQNFKYSKNSCFWEPSIFIYIYFDLVADINAVYIFFLSFRFHYYLFREYWCIFTFSNVTILFFIFAARFLILYCFYFSVRCLINSSTLIFFPVQYPYPKINIFIAFNSFFVLQCSVSLLSIYKIYFFCVAMIYEHHYLFKRIGFFRWYYSITFKWTFIFMQCENFVTYLFSSINSFEIFVFRLCRVRVRGQGQELGIIMVAFSTLRYESCSNPKYLLTLFFNIQCKRMRIEYSTEPMLHTSVFVGHE